MKSLRVSLTLEQTAEFNWKYLIRFRRLRILGALKKNKTKQTIVHNGGRKETNEKWKKFAR